jgi:aminocarboxymuconate-semialdehyde decarboxylase
MVRWERSADRPRERWLTAHASKMRTIDIHTHLYPEPYLDLLRSREAFPRIRTSADGEVIETVIEGRGFPLSAGFWSVDEKLAFMDRWGLQKSLVSIGNPWLRFIDDTEESVAVARELNNQYAAIAKTQSRLEALGVLPSWDLDGAVNEVERLASEGILKGIATGPSLCGKTLDDPELEPLWERLSVARMIVQIHPGEYALDGALLGLTAAINFPCETTIAAARLLEAKVLLRYPEIRFLLAHGGGALPFLLGRLDHFSNATGSERPSVQAREFFTDNVVYQDRVLGLVYQAFGPDRLMFGSDHPFDARPEPPSSDGLGPSGTVAELIDHRNAATLLSA